MVSFRRTLKLGSTGRDCVAVKRALARAGFGSLKNPAVWNPVFGVFAVRNLKRFQVREGIPGSGVYGPVTHEKLESYFDAYSDSIYGDPALDKARALLAFCRKFDGPYVYGGGHGPLLSRLSVHQGLDCSSSTSLALWLARLYAEPVAHVSGWFESWGLPGRGRYITVHATGDHVWIELDLPEGWFRFDTSPWGDGPRGARVRRRPRSSSRFVHRHPKGL